MPGKKIKEMYSCKRKTDYMTFTAIMLFIAIAAFEVYLTFIIPIQLNRRSTLEQHVAREEITSQLDFLRGEEIAKFGVFFESFSLEEAKLHEAEINLMKTFILDRYATYIRENVDNMTMSQIVAVKDMLNQCEFMIGNWKNGDFYFKNEKIDITPFLNQIDQKISDAGKER